MPTLEELKSQNESLQQQIRNVEQTLAQLQVHQNVEVTQQTIVHVPVPDKFTFEKDEWETWLTAYNRYRIATALNRQPESTQINNLLLHMGSQVDRLLATLGKKAEDIKTYKEAIDIFTNHYVKKINKIYERAKFNMRNQREGESAADFVSNVIQLAKTCDYGQLHDDLVRDRLVVGIVDRRLSETLQLDESLTLQKAIDKILQSETVRHQTSDITRSQMENSKVDRVVQKKQFRRNNHEERKTNTKENKDRKYPKCRRCGAIPSHELKACPALNVICKKCRVKGHYARCCRTRNIRELVHEEEQDDIQEDEDLDEDLSMEEVIKVGEINTSNNKPWICKLQCAEEQQTIKFKIDTGADETLITKRQYNELRQKTRLKNTNSRLHTAGGGRLKVYGITEFKIERNGKTSTIKAYVTETSENLLGRPAIQELNLLKRINNVNKKDDYKENITKKFPKLFKGLGCLKDKEYEIKVTQDTIPFSINTPRRVPVPLMPKVKKELERMTNAGVIEPITEPSEWCAPVVIVTKKSGDIRMCGDYTELNKYIRREKLILPSVDETLAQVKQAKYFSKLDASSGFWQVRLKENAQHFTTFITPFGKFAYKRLPFGISSAPEVYQKYMFDIVRKLPGVLSHADDIIIWGEDEEQHDKNLINVLRTLEENGITLNAKKCEFKVCEIKFLGHIINEKGIKPNEDLIKAINNFKEPKNVTEVRQFLGMVNHLTKFLRNSADETKCLRELLKKNKHFLWSPEHQKCFNRLKQILTTKPILAMYDSNLETRVSADSSSYGIGGVLEQKQTNGIWKPVIYCSKSLSESEKRYAQIEKEALALTWTCERLQQYLIGKEITLKTDHKPLTSILMSKPMNELTMRLQRFRMRLVKFNYKVEYIPGKEFYTPDALSRNPENHGSTDRDVMMDEDCEVYSYIDTVTKILETKRRDDHQIKLFQEQSKEPIFETLKQYVKNGWPEKRKCENTTLPYYKYRFELNIQNNLLCYRDRIVIPGSIRKQMLEKIHIGHQGIIKCQERAKMLMWWPNMYTQIAEIVQNCERCLKNKNNPAEPLINTNFPPIPWTTIAVDLCEYKDKTYMVVQDYYSKFIEIAKVRKTKSEDIIENLKIMFARFGIPSVIRSDNGPQFASWEFQKFAKDYGFKNITSSPRYAQSNGLVERAVQTWKNILKKCEDPYMGLLTHRNTNLKCGASPAQLLMGRNLRDVLPINEKNLIPKLPNHKEAFKKMKVEQENQKANFDKRHRARQLRGLDKEEKVWIIDMKRYGTVITNTDQPRSYSINTEKGEVRRNRKSLIPISTTKNIERNGAAVVPSRAVPEEEKQTTKYKSNRKKQFPKKLKDYII